MQHESIYKRKLKYALYWFLNFLLFLLISLFEWQSDREKGRSKVIYSPQMTTIARAGQVELKCQDSIRVSHIDGNFPQYLQPSSASFPQRWVRCGTARTQTSTLLRKVDATNCGFSLLCHKASHLSLPLCCCCECSIHFSILSEKQISTN